MGRRHFRKDYSLPGIFHVTVSVNRDLRQPLGKVVGDAREPDGSANAPRVELTALGRMVEQELTGSISRHYPMVEIQDHVVMPEHLHAIVVVKSVIISANGRQTHLGQVIAGFKKGCNRRYWEITGQLGEPADARKTQQAGTGAMPPTQRSEPADARKTQQAGTGAMPPGQRGEPADERGLRPVVHPQGLIKRTPSEGTTGRPPLFAEGYVDVMPVKEGLLEQQRKYIRDNPRSRLLRSGNRSQLQPQRLSIKTALSEAALKRFLEQECHPSQVSGEQWQELQERLLIENGMIACDSYGSIEIADRRMLPVVCHRKDSRLFEQQKTACMRAAESGVILVSARIAKGEQAIMDEVAEKGYPIVVIVDNGFPEIYHPSKEKMDSCLKGRLLLVSPWKYCYRLAENGISVAECKAMNCVAQALCRKRDDWWKEER